MDILRLDNRIVVCIKPAGVVSTDEPGGLPDRLREELGGGEVCLRTVHRLDQPVSGVMVLARSREAARRLSAQMEGGGFHKEYLAVVHGEPEEDEGRFCDLLSRSKEERKTYITHTPGKDAREARLSYRVLGRREGLTLVSVALETGRTHQIRAQFSGRGFPLVGDKKYGAPEADMEGIALWSHRLEFLHPQTEEPVAVSALPPARYPWNLFGEILDETDRGSRENKQKNRGKHHKK